MHDLELQSFTLLNGKKTVAFGPQVASGSGRQCRCVDVDLTLVKL